MRRMRNATSVKLYKPGLERSRGRNTVNAEGKTTNVSESGFWELWVTGVKKKKNSPRLLFSAQEHHES